MWLLYAAASAVCFGLRGILYQWSSHKPLNRNAMLLGVYASGAAVSLAANAFAGQDWSRGAWMGVVMGAFSFVSNASMYKGFAVGKASLVAVFTALPAAVVSVGAYALWGETLNSWQLGALAVILSGILIIRYTNELSWSNMKGVQWAIIALFGFAITDLASKQSQLWQGEVLPTLTVMFSTGSLLFLASWLGERRPDVAAAEVAAASEEEGGRTVEVGDRKAGAAAKRWPDRRAFAWGIAVGVTNVSGMMLVLPAFKLGVTGLVSAVIATNVLLILLYTRVFGKERFTRLQSAGIALTLVGVILLRLLE